MGQGLAKIAFNRMKKNNILKEEKLGKKLLNLIRERRKYEVRTLYGYVPFSMQMYHLLSDEIEILFREIGARNKTKILKEMAKVNITGGSFKEKISRYKRYKNEK